MGKLNCWEFKKCERQPGGDKVHELGICPAAREHKLDGIHDGKNAGRACWVIAKSLCGNKVQGNFAEKFGNCSKCAFYQSVKKEEAHKFKLSANLLRILHSEENPKE